MNTTPLSSRARTLGLVATAGVTALIGTVAVDGSAGASALPTGTTVPRLELSYDVWCHEGDLASVTVYYDDLADGHVPQEVHEQVVDTLAGSTVVWTRGDLYQEYGNYFNLEVFSFVGGTAPFDRNATIDYSVTMSYDDGETQTQSLTVDLADECVATTPTPTSPPAPQPEPDRFGLEQNGFVCGERGERAFVVWHYQDYPDGHYAARSTLQVLKNGVLIDQLEVIAPDPSSDGAADELVIPEGNLSDAPLEVASYSLSMTVTYEDGATDTHIETFDLNALCDGRVNGRTAVVPTTAVPTTTPSNSGATTTTVPTGTLPETGSGNLTWVIGAVAGLLTTAGAALFAGVRRSRID